MSTISGVELCKKVVLRGRMCERPSEPDGQMQRKKWMINGAMAASPDLGTFNEKCTVRTEKNVNKSVIDPAI